MAKRRNNASRLRTSVYAMPTHTQQAMLRGIRTSRVIVGAYTDKRGGVCPMLAAHRNGGRTNFGTFARAWDAFTGAKPNKPRRASRREVSVLEGYLETSLMRKGMAEVGASPDRPLAEEVREIQATRRRLAEAEARESTVSVEDVLNTAYSEHAVDESVEEVEDQPSTETGWFEALERADATTRG
jgi:hypothetical protein